MANEKSIDLEQNAIFLLIGDYLHDKNFGEIFALIKDFHPADIAFLLNLLDEDDTLEIINRLTDDVQAEVIPELSDSKQRFLAQNLHNNVLSQIIEEMESDDAADLVGLMDAVSQEQLLEKVEREDAEEVRELLKHKSDTAGGLMTKEVVAISQNANVERAITEIRNAVKETEQIYNVFVVDSENNKLLGILPLNALVLAKPDTMVSDIMGEVKSVDTSMDQEDVARIVKKYDLVEVPVVDEDYRLVGRITHDDILDVVEEEAEEDFAKMAGTGNEDLHGHSSFEISRKRLTWLIIGLFGGILSAIIMSRFEVALGKILLLAFFIPVIMAMGGIVGIQSSTITVRGLATGEILRGKLLHKLTREVIVCCINGTVCGLILALLIFLWYNDIMLGGVVGGSLFCVMLISTLSGTLIPLALDKLNIDPALATGPFVTTFNDILGLSIYFLLTSFLL
ncbi:MAG: magnesium transporter [Fibrobacteria bacterium]|nr:magnesium transporter [Fibrobacteria bacterium]